MCNGMCSGCSLKSDCPVVQFLHLEERADHYEAVGAAHIAEAYDNAVVDTILERGGLVVGRIVA